MTARQEAWGALDIIRRALRAAAALRKQGEPGQPVAWVEKVAKAIEEAYDLGSDNARANSTGHPGRPFNEGIRARSLLAALGYTEPGK